MGEYLGKLIDALSTATTAEGHVMLQRGSSIRLQRGVSLTQAEIETNSQALNDTVSAAYTNLDHDAVHRALENFAQVRFTLTSACLPFVCRSRV